MKEKSRALLRTRPEFLMYEFYPHGQEISLLGNMSGASERYPRQAVFKELCYKAAADNSTPIALIVERIRPSVFSDALAAPAL